MAQVSIWIVLYFGSLQNWNGQILKIPKAPFQIF